MPWPRLRWPLLASAMVQSVLVQGDRQPSVDGLAYFDAGRNLLEGRGYTRHGLPELHFPPVTPIAFATIERVVGDEVGTLRSWHLAWGLAAVVLITATAWAISQDERATVVAAWVATTVGGLISLSIRGGSGSELPVTCLLLVAVLLLVPLVRGGVDPPTQVEGRFALAGAAVGLAYASRPEALLVGSAVLAIAGVHVLRAHRIAWRRLLVGLLLAGAALVVLAAPEVIHLHRHTGSWTLTAKTQDASIEAWRSVAEGDRLARDRVLYEIQPDGVTLGPETRSLTALALDDPGGWLGILGANVREVLRLYLVVQILPFFLLIPAVATLWALRRDAAAQLLAVVALGPLATCLIFFTMPRYLMTTTAVLCAFGAVGLTGWIDGRPPEHRRRWWAAVIVGSLASLLIAAWPLLPGTGMGEPTGQRDAGIWIAEHTPDDARIMTRSFHVQGYAEREVVALPVGELPEVLSYARRMGATHLVADASTMRGRRPELVEPLVEGPVPDGLVLVHQMGEGRQTVRIFRLDPPPPASDQPPRWLGYVSD